MGGASGPEHGAVLTARARLLVSGRVQGVFFRVRAAEKARALGLCGWVRNLPDGRVEALVEGPAQAVEAMTGWCRTGPPGASVAAVDVEQLDPSGSETDFRIIH